MISEIKTTEGIVENFLEEILNSLELDVAVVGAGPSGLIAAKYLSDAKLNVAVFERKLSVGGGMWGGGMLFPKIVVEKEAKFILDEIGIKTKIFDDDTFIANSIEVVAKITSAVIDAGAKIFNSIDVEDVMIRDNKIYGVVVNWSAVKIAKLHVDPLAFKSKIVVDATGHSSEICKIVQKKVGKLETPSGEIIGERSMWIDKSERLVVENTKEVYPNLYVTGMAANAVFGAPRMGPIFGGMFLSGKKVAELIISNFDKIKKNEK